MTKPTPTTQRHRAQLMLKKDDQSYYILPATPEAYASQIKSVAFIIEATRFSEPTFEGMARKIMASLGIVRPRVTSAAAGKGRK